MLDGRDGKLGGLREADVSRETQLTGAEQLDPPLAQPAEPVRAAVPEDSALAGFGAAHSGP